MKTSYADTLIRALVAIEACATDPMRDALDRLDDRTAEDIARIAVIVSAGL